MTLHLDGLNHESSSGALMAHEMGHVLGNFPLNPLEVFELTIIGGGGDKPLPHPHNLAIFKGGLIR